MIPATDIVTPRFQLAVLAAILCQVPQSVAIPTIVSAAEQEPPARHGLIQRSAAESAALPPTTHGTILQPSSAESTHITSGIEPHKPSVSPTPLPAPHHRTLTKRPAIATITAPATPPQTPSAASVSGVTDGQAAQAPADTAKSTTPTATAPTHPGTTPAATATVAPAGSSPPVGTAGVQAAASAGNGSTPSSSGSRSASNLLKNPAIMSLLQPSTPVVTAPPPSTPPPTPPPSSPPASPSTANVTLTWAANMEPDLAGYKIYVGTNSGTYNYPGSPFVAGTVTSYTVAGLPNGQTYVFAISAYDGAGNESGLSAEVSKSLY